MNPYFPLDVDGVPFALVGVSHIDVEGVDVVVHFLDNRPPRIIGGASCEEHARYRATALTLRCSG